MSSSPNTAAFAENGLAPHHAPTLRNRLGRIARDYREYLAEFIGTAILLFLGDSVVAMTVFHKDTAGAAYLAITIGWGVALICALYVAGPISGGHFNPAVTIAAAVHRGFSWKKVPGFIAAQMVGAFVGAALVFAQYRSAFHAYDGGVRAVTGDTATAGIFATYPSAYMTHLNAVWNEFITTAMLIIAIYGCVDPRGKGAVGHSTLAIGFILIAIGLCIGHGTGYAINPARDFGPRVFTAAAGWGADVFSAADYYFWIPLIIPVPGAIFGGYVYDFFIHYDVPLATFNAQQAAAAAVDDVATPREEKQLEYAPVSY